MYNNLDALQKLGVLLKKKNESSPLDEEHFFIERVAVAISELDSIHEDLKKDKWDPSFRSELYSIIKQAMEERSI